MLDSRNSQKGVTPQKTCFLVSQQSGVMVPIDFLQSISGEGWELFPIVEAGEEFLSGERLLRISTPQWRDLLLFRDEILLAASWLSGIATFTSEIVKKLAIPSGRLFLHSSLFPAFETCHSQVVAAAAGRAFNPMGYPGPSLTEAECRNTDDFPRWIQDLEDRSFLTPPILFAETPDGFQTLSRYFKALVFQGFSVEFLESELSDLRSARPSLILGLFGEYDPFWVRDLLERNLLDFVYLDGWSFGIQAVRMRLEVEN